MLQLKGDTGNGVDALKRHPKIRSVTPQKRVERFLKSVEGTVQQDSFKINLKSYLTVWSFLLHWGTK